MQSRRLLIVFAALALLSAACGGDSEDAPGETPLPAGRTQLSLCVQQLGESADAVETDQDTIANIADSLNDQLDALDVAPARSVSEGCPSPIVQLGSPLNEGADFGRHVDSKSEHEAFVYVLEPDLYARTFGDRPYMTTTAEFVCQGDACIGVTIGLYIPPSIPRTVLDRAVASAIPLLRPTPEPEPTPDWESCVRGGQPDPTVDCDRYDDWREMQERIDEGN